MDYSYCCHDFMTGLHEEPDESSPLRTEVVMNEPISLFRSKDDWSEVVAAHYPKHSGWLKSQVLQPNTATVADWLAECSSWDLREILQWPQTLVGGEVPYLWGGMSSDGIDCSGLVHMAYRYMYGVLIPRDSVDQEAAGEVISFEELRCGDLITYGKSEDPLGGNPVHIAFYAGDGQIIHANGNEYVMRVLQEPESERLILRRRKALRIDPEKFRL